MSDDFKALEVWKLSKEMVKQVYTCCKDFPKEEVYGLLAQIKRSAISVPSNIAEGSNRRSVKEFIAELETQLIIAYELKFMKETDLSSLSFMIRRIGQMLTKTAPVNAKNDKRLTINE